MAEQKLSFGEEISLDRRKAEFGVVTISAMPGTVFSIVVPKHWKRVPVQARTLAVRPGWREVDAFAGSNDISVHVFQVDQPYEVNLTDWLKYQASLLSLTLVVEQHGETEFGQMVHASGRTANGDRLRLVAAGDGRYQIVLIGRAAPEAAPDADALLGLCAGSFLFQKHSRAVSRERLSWYSDDRKTFRLLYPESWKVETRPKQSARRAVVEFRITGADDTTAYVRVTADLGPAVTLINLKTVFEETVQDLADAGIPLETIEAMPSGPGGGARERWLGSCKLPTGRGQVALLFRRGATGWLTVVMLSPEKSANPHAWMRAKRFYEILTASLNGFLNAGERKLANH